MNQKGHFIQKEEMSLKRNEVPGKGEPLALEIESFLIVWLRQRRLKRMDFCSLRWRSFRVQRSKLVAKKYKKGYFV